MASLTIAGSISGKVTSVSGEELAGANVYIKGTTIGAASGTDGTYRIEVEDGNYNVICDFVGYAQRDVQIAVAGDVTLNFTMEEYLFAKTISVVADRARERETPVAYSNVEKERIEANLGSQDIPMVLNSTPSVYATVSGGGAGDARINVRGFNQRNIAIMINGMPVNDMENGWVYWSNWDGLGDATSSIQMQRGLSAVNLATPSIGGTMNILTDPTAVKPGVRFKQEFGSAGFLKSTLSGGTGLIDGKYAVSATVVRKVGDGLIDGTWTDAWAYYLGASYNINDNNRLELYAMGAPQRHGQRLYMQNIAVFSQSFAKDLADYDKDALDTYPEAATGRKYNQNWGPVSSSYNGEQYYNGSSGERYDKSFINERENYYNKPLINLNWFTQLSQSLSLKTIVYYSGGTGGGTGEYGRLEYDYSTPTRTPDWDATIARNVDSTTFRYGAKEKGQSVGLLRNSTNNQWTTGIISKAYWKASENLVTAFGVDWRMAEIDHYREIRDLLGGSYFLPEANQLPVSDFWSESEKTRRLGDKVDYHFTNTVDWYGVFGQAEYTKDALTAYGMLGLSTIKYSYENFFIAQDTLANGNPDLNSGTLKENSGWINGLQVKGGASYRLDDNYTVFGNLGYISKVPIFDEVIDDRNGIKNEEHENEIFYSVEAGVNYVTSDRKLNLKLNGYFTRWQNRSYRDEEFGPEEILVFLSGVDADHMGVEFEMAYQPIELLRLDAAASFGNWKYLNDVDGETRIPGTTQQTKYQVYIKDLYVGDSPQTQIALAGSVFPVKGLMAQLAWRYYDRHYSAFNPFDRDDPNDKVQPWLTPSYHLFDVHASYDLPINLSGVSFQLFLHAFNIFDTEYIQDSLDNSPYNGFSDTHKASDAEVFLGMPRFINGGLQILY
jgi:iron complex outermembrane recepter protein